MKELLVCTLQTAGLALAAAFPGGRLICKCEPLQGADRCHCWSQKHGAFTLVLSGGSLLKALGKLVGMPGVDYAKWHVFYADERNVPHDSDDCTHKGAHEAFLSKVHPALPLNECLYCVLLQWANY